jgi:hypothetical protein
LKTIKELIADQESAARFEHPERLMRITLECGHFRLQQFIVAATGGIGWSTACKICEETQGKQVVRVIVNVEETGTL